MTAIADATEVNRLPTRKEIVLPNKFFFTSYDDIQGIPRGNQIALLESTATSWLDQVHLLD